MALKAALMLSAILKSAKSSAVVPAELTFGVADLGAALSTDQLFLWGWRENSGTRLATTLVLRRKRELLAPFLQQLYLRLPQATAIGRNWLRMVRELVCFASNGSAPGLMAA